MNDQITSREDGGSRRLDSWKEIAAYLERSVRTVQRWEKEEGLPVYRRELVEGQSAAQNQRQVFAYTSEIDAWWQGFAAGESDQTADRPPAPTPPPSPAARGPRSYHPWLIVAGAALLVAAVVWRFESTPPEAADIDLPALEMVRELRFPVYAISPDGQLLAYREDPQRDLWVERLDGSGGRRKMASGYRGSGPVWSTDSTRIVFPHFTPDRTCGLRMVDVNTDEVRDLWDGECRDPQRPNAVVWHPVEEALLCRRSLPDRQWSMAMLDVQTGEIAEVFRDRAPMTGFQFSPDGRLLAYSAARNGNGDVYTRAVSGGDPVRITEHPAPDLAPIWTSDGNSLLFLSQRGGATFDLWSVALSWRGRGRAPTLASPMGLLQGGGLSMRLLPDGSLLYRREAPNTQAVLLSVHPATGASTADSPEQFKIGTASPEYFDGGRTLQYSTASFETVERDLETGVERVMPRDEIDGEAGVRVKSTQRSPVAFYGFDKQGSRGFQKLDENTRSLRLLRVFEEPVNPPLSWSPDHEEILFEVFKDGKFRILALSADGKRLREAAVSQSRAFARWSPDGSEIAFTDSGCLMTVKREGGPVRRILCSSAAPPRSLQGILRSALGVLAWSPSGDKIAWTVYHPDRTAVDVWIVDRETGAHHVAWTGESELASWPSELEWSPKGDSIAFTKRFQRRWEIWKLRNFLPLSGRS